MPGDPRTSQPGRGVTPRYHAAAGHDFVDVTSQGAEGVAGASVPGKCLAEIRCTEPVEGRVAGGKRRCASYSGTAQSTGCAVAEPPSGAHGEAAHISGVVKHGRTRLCAHDPTDGLAGDAGDRRGDPGDGHPETAVRACPHRQIGRRLRDSRTAVRPWRRSSSRAQGGRRRRGLTGTPRPRRRRTEVRTCRSRRRSRRPHPHPHATDEVVECLLQCQL